MAKDGRRTYTEQERKDALALYAERGPTFVQEEMGIPKATVRDWARKAGVQTVRTEKTRAAVEATIADRQALREQARDLMAQRVVDLLERINSPHVEFVGKDGRREQIERATAQATRDYSVSVGVLIDKLRLELGEATSRSEEIKKDKVDAAIEELIAEMERKDKQNGSRVGGR